MDAAANHEAPVLIVGAGPTGLAAAMTLARARIPVRLVDRAMQPNRYSRAIGIQARTLELLEQHRLAERFLELGHRARVANLFSNGMRLAQLDFDPLHTRYPYLLFLDQSVTERLLTEHLATLGVTIERGVELTMFSQGSAGVQATLRRADGHTETLRPSYMIAADGAHSLIRHGLGLDFEGKTLEQTFLLADVHAETDWPEDEFHIFASGEGLVALFPMGHGRHRLIADHAVEPAPQPAAPPSPVVLGEPPLSRMRTPSLEECKALLARRVHERVDVSDLAWSSYFHVNSRMVERLRVGRVFLAGDAAHVHSPAGAQGMNTGIQEAFNLGWKLARVLKGAAPDRLLDTYHLERHPIERDVLRQTGFITQMAEADHGPLKLLRERVMPVLAALGPLRDAARLTISELSIQYRRSPLTLERVLDGGPRAGERAPDAVVHVVDGPLGRAPGIGCIYDLHDPAFFSLFLLVPPLPVDGKPLDPDAKHEPPPDAELERLSVEMERLLPGAVRIWRVTDTTGDGGPSLAESYGRTRPSFYLLRPDGYISARGRTGSDLNGLLQHCETWFTVGGQIPEQAAL
ncbi:3-(3-hydroxy-phenyl)propionate/3-hydroxycinnamic acid hydroxylase [Paraburkholderia phenoliruptrix]|uniref:3-(3-hydroxy-phenyl)propionate/3-hydroxycinnamic acid hydroxylase n=1 Tax=Paraburkholderia phenoliruptrix TaxID=252970 RepID=A0A6J5AMC9_9BURK|nr:FAD-dependent monooxygenase [Paraburkholderia phenoliruptrix]CAB3675439.1 3-(3-hydroxy-phenyl)propionate/3-hydroxycinnamic acid hydroxylase [Paraburkholderia phenoliruptrix]